MNRPEFVYAPYILHATKARVVDKIVMIELGTGLQIGIPIAILGEPWTTATKMQLANVRLEGEGTSLWWDNLDEGFVLDECLPMWMGIKPASILARLARGKSTPKKAAAARLNGKKGGRPRKTAA